jgi:hypothetical protein
MLLGMSFWAQEANLNLLARRDLERLLAEALPMIGRSTHWSVSNHRLLGLPSNLIAWVSEEEAL